ncbi:MAG: hypothetical protein HY430_02650 [Candidatus Levybacteria bacterium]|nr:hypothetical protein [Candidatus Levybacteria bacterium]
MKEMQQESFHPGLRIIHQKGSSFERSVGRVGSVPFNLLSPSEALKSYPEEKIRTVTEIFQETPWRGQIDVYLNHAPFRSQVKRLFAKERRTNIVARATVGIPATGVIWSVGKLFRKNMYNPYTETVMNYRSKPWVVAHEIGHAMDYDQAKHPTLKALLAPLPIARSMNEWRASRNAISLFKPEQMKRVRKSYETMLGRHVGGDLFYLLLLAGLTINPAYLVFGGSGVGLLNARFSKKDPFTNGIRIRRKRKEIVQHTPTETIVELPS